jgi:L-iditol 2-dehydrogenase/galactitol-1-phosphate 5-dehydrogenase
MKAVVLEGPNTLVSRDLPEPEPLGPDSVLVRIGAVGVCGSDVLRFGKGKAYHYPLVLGHEFSAIVESAPPTSRFRAGDRAAVFPCLPPQGDPMTEIGEFVLSTDYDYFGSRRDGALQEFLHVPERNLIPVPEGFSLVKAAMVEPAAVALHGVRKLDIPANGVALVIGAGPIGALAAQWLRILGCTRVVVADVDARKRAIMTELGFETIDAKVDDTVRKIRELTGGRGPSIAVEASGLPFTLLQAIEAVSVFGQVLLLGDISGDLTIPQPLVSSVLRREVRLIGTWNSKITPDGLSDWEMVISHMQGALIVEPLVSHVASLDEAPALFDAMLKREVWYNKVIFAVADEALAERPAFVDAA